MQAVKPVRRAVKEQVKVKSFAGRGTEAEKVVKDFLDLWVVGSPFREFSRLTDSKAAGRIIKAAPADFEYFCHRGLTPQHGLIEVKQTEHEYRLARDKVPQLARLRKREKCGGTCCVLVYHSTLKTWRVIDTLTLADTGDKGSWNLAEEPQFPTVAQALTYFSEAFRE